MHAGGALRALEIPFGTASTQGYALLGLEARTTLDLGLSPVLVSIRVDNLLDEVYRRDENI